VKVKPISALALPADSPILLGSRRDAMADEYGIRIICSYPKCGAAFFMAREGEKPRTFSSVEEAFMYRERLQRQSSVGGLAGRGTSDSSPGELPARCECPKCHSIFSRNEVTFFVARLPEEEPVPVGNFVY
jgi:hypothetical protein